MTPEQWNDILWRIDEFRIAFWLIALYFFFGPTLRIKYTPDKEKDETN